MSLRSRGRHVTDTGSMDREIRAWAAGATSGWPSPTVAGTGCRPIAFRSTAMVGPVPRPGSLKATSSQRRISVSLAGASRFGATRRSQSRASARRGSPCGLTRVRRGSGHDAAMSIRGYFLPGIATSAFGTCDPPRSDSVSAGSLTTSWVEGPPSRFRASEHPSPAFSDGSARNRAKAVV